MRRIFLPVALLGLACSISNNADAVATLIRWKFPKGNKYVYSLDYATRKYEGFERIPKKEQKNLYIKGEGSIIISCQGDDAIITKIYKANIQESEEKKLTEEDLAKIEPTSVSLTMKSDGTIKNSSLFPTDGTHPGVDMLFLLPVETLKKGEKVTLEMLIPFSEKESLKGAADHEYKGIKKVEGIDCDEYTTALKLQYEFPKDDRTSTITKYIYEGEIEILFALGPGYLVSAIGTLKLSIISTIILPDDDDKPEFPTIIEEKISVKLKYIEPAKEKQSKTLPLITIF